MILVNVAFVHIRVENQRGIVQCSFRWPKGTGKVCPEPASGAAALTNSRLYIGPRIVAGAAGYTPINRPEDSLHVI